MQNNKVLIALVIEVSLINFPSQECLKIDNLKHTTNIYLQLIIDICAFKDILLTHYATVQVMKYKSSDIKKHYT